MGSKNSKLNSSENSVIITQEQNTNILCGACQNDEIIIEKWYIHLIQECKQIDNLDWAKIIIQQGPQIHSLNNNSFKQDIRIILQNPKVLLHYKSQIWESNPPILNKSKVEMDETKKIKKLLKKTMLFEENLVDEDIDNSIVNLDSKDIYQTNPFKQKGKIPSYIFPVQMLNKLEQEENEFKRLLETYIKVIDVIKNNHLVVRNFPLTIIKNIFITQFISEYQQILDQNQNIDDYVESSVYEIQQFIRIFQEVISIFYDLKHFDKSRINIYKADNILNFVTSNLFENKDINLIFFTIISLYFTNDNKKLRQVMEESKSLQPEDFGVPPKFCLNFLTYQHLKKKGLIGMEQITENSYEDENMSYNIQPLTQVEEKLKYVQKIEPYHNCIKIIQKLEKNRGPFSKLRLLIKTSEALISCIQEFYKQLGTTFNNIIDSEAILSIFTYLISKSWIDNLLTHSYFIEKFQTNNMLNSVSGYYLVTFKSALEILIETSKKSIQGTINDEKKV